jgi:CubicO group peptidase (beta-lactamase class C family)
MARRRSVHAASAAVLALVTAVLGGGTPAAPAAPTTARPVPVAAGVATAAGTGGADAVLAAYRARIPRLMAEQGVPGVAVVVVDGDRVLWEQGFGSTDRDGGVPVTPDTIFSVQSMSKTFTATAVLQAVQAGRLDLDAPLARYLPGFTVHSAFEQHPERRITVRMLLSCTAGLGHEAPLGNNYTPEVGTFDDHVRSIGRTWLRFPVGTGFAYSNEGFDLAGYVLEQVSGKPFPEVVHDSLLAPLGMDRSTFDRAAVRAATNRAVGHTGGIAPPRLGSPMTAAGGLWTSAADLARFLRFQLDNGRVDGRTVLDPSLLRQMRTVPDSPPSTTAGYALGIARTRWQAAQNLDLFTHGGGGEGFLSDLWFAPQLRLGVAVLTNSDDNRLQGSVAMGILNDLVAAAGSPYGARLRGLPVQPAVLPRGGDFVPPADLAARIGALALPATAGQAARWAAYPEHYRVGRLGAMDPAKPASRFHVEAGVPLFDAGEDGSLVRHRLTEFRPGLFLADDGDTLDLRPGSRSWRGLELQAVTDGPRPWQWGLLALGALVAAAWLVLGLAALVRGRRRRHGASPVASGAGWGRRLTAVVATLGCIAALVTVAAVVVLPGLADVGFLGWIASPLPVRLAFHLPLAAVVLAASLTALLVTGARRRWWAPGAAGDRPALRVRRGLVAGVRREDLVLLLALGALCGQLAAWHLVGWGF